MLNFGNKEFRNLQEQVLKNAQDIETLKGREDLQIVIVNELPEVGNPNYIYLVAKDDGESPDVYDEYIWLEDEERYEKIGGVSIDLTNYVTLDSEQSITGVKIISNGNKLIFAKPEVADYWIRNGNGSVDFGTGESNTIVRFSTSGVQFDQDVKPFASNSKSLGDSTHTWKDAYFSGSVIFGTGLYIASDASGRIGIYYNNVEKLKIGADNGTYCATNWVPDNNNFYNLGSAAFVWKTTYTGSISNGSTELSISNISSKVTSAFISGTFDSNGESTIDTEQAGTPEGLFIFTYGNCQCFLRLTATMVQNADTAPIRVSIPMIYNSGTVNGWLNITKSGYILILTITDGTNHVDSGYAWTLTKTNLI